MEYFQVNPDGISHHQTNNVIILKLKKIPVQQMNYISIPCPHQYLALT